MSNCCLETKCMQCCIQTNMILSYRDIAIIEQMGYEKIFFVSENDGWLQLKNVDGRCVFHNGIECIIYPKRPQGCTLYPVVYDNDDKRAILDDECPQRHCFSLSKTKVLELKSLIALLEKERTERMKKNIRSTTQKTTESR